MIVCDMWIDKMFIQDQDVKIVKSRHEQRWG
jgi:hypothetical protein